MLKLEPNSQTQTRDQLSLPYLQDAHTKTLPPLNMQAAQAEIIEEEGFLSSDNEECLAQRDVSPLPPPTADSKHNPHHSQTNTNTQSHAPFTMHTSKVRSVSLSSLSPIQCDSYINTFATGSDSHNSATLRRESCPERSSQQNFGLPALQTERQPVGITRPRSGSLNDTFSRQSRFLPLSTDFRLQEDSFLGLPNPRKSSAPCFSTNTLHDPFDSHRVGRRLTADSADALAQLFHSVDLASVHSSPTQSHAGIPAFGGNNNHYEPHTGLHHHAAQQHRRRSSHEPVDELDADLISDFLQSANSRADQQLKAILAALNGAAAGPGPKHGGLNTSSLPDENMGGGYGHEHGTDGEDGDGQMMVDLTGNDSESGDMENGGGKCNKARPRRPRNQLARQYVCPLSHTGCERRYEAWRSLQHHLWAHHSIRFRKLDYDRLFPQLSIHQIISSQDLLYPHILREKLQAANQKYQQQNTIRPRAPANSVPTSGISSPAAGSPQNFAVKNNRNVAPYSANSSPIVRARNSFLRPSENSMWGGSREVNNMGTLMEDGISRGPISSVSSPSLPVGNQLAWDNLLERLQM